MGSPAVNESGFSVCRSGFLIVIAGDLKLQRSRVAGKRRLEVVGFDAAELQWLKTLGVFSEYVQYRLRAFVPNDATAVGIVERIIEAG